MLKQRIITAVILATLLMLILYSQNTMLLTGLVAVIFFTAGWEWSGLLPLSAIAFRIGYMAVMALVFYFTSSEQWLFLPIALLLWFGNFIAVVSYPASKRYWGNPATVGLAGLILLPVFTHCLIQLYQQPEGLKWLLSLLFIIWAADIGAYFTGRAWGTHKMIPQVSPGKSWEGLLGGLLSVVMIAGVCLIWLNPPSLLIWFGLAIVTALISVLGDLFFSVLKRRCGLKDTGKLLPGHGGILDRLDSLIAALPFFFWSLQYMMSQA